MVQPIGTSYTHMLLNVFEISAKLQFVPVYKLFDFFILYSPHRLSF